MEPREVKGMHVGKATNNTNFYYHGNLQTHIV